MWNDISERCTGSGRSSGKAHLFGRRDISVKTKLVLRWPRKPKGVRVWGQPTSPLKSIFNGQLSSWVNYHGLFYFPTIRKISGLLYVLSLTYWYEIFLSKQ